MCILIAKQRESRKMTEQEIRNSANANPDGFGIAFVLDTPQINVYKTFNVSEIIEINNSLPDDAAVLYHFRIATHGSVSLANCHPFLDEKLGVAFAHNGILSVKSHEDMTDSETAFRYLLSPHLRDNMDILQNDDLDIAVESIIGTSKFAFINESGDVKTYGQFIIDDGLLFSNSSYQYHYMPEFTPSQRFYYGYDWYDEEKGLYDDYELDYYSAYQEAYDLLKEKYKEAIEARGRFTKKDFKLFKAKCAFNGLDCLSDNDLKEIKNLVKNYFETHNINKQKV